MKANKSITNWKKKTLTAATALAAMGLVVANSACAEDIELSYGVDITTNYLSKGFTQTDDGPAIQPYVELAYGPAYLEFWGSNASFGGVNDIEFDVGIGFRPDIGIVDLDVGFVQYFYLEDKTNYGEAYLKLGYGVSDTGEIEFGYWREVYHNYNTFYLSGSVSDLPWGLTLSGGVGSDFGSRNLAKDAVYADIGLSKDINDNIAFDLRGNYSAIEGNVLTATLSFFN